MNNSIYILILIVILQLAVLQYSVKRPKRRIEKAGNRPLFVDTSALMDGRIVTIASLGFLPSPVIIPRSVMLELQLLADKADSDKRMRARAGLDAIKQLQQVDSLEVKVLNETFADGVDNHLLALARQHDGKICTIDFNLNKVAQAESIPVVNPNELSKNIRMAYLPGEKLSLELVQKGQGSNQAVGYLADGTMVVVEQSAGSVGKTIEVEFIRALQTAAGRMMFAKPVKADTAKGKRTGSQRTYRKSNLKSKQPRGGEDRLVALANSDNSQTN